MADFDPTAEAHKITDLASKSLNQTGSDHTAEGPLLKEVADLQAHPERMHGVEKKLWHDGQLVSFDHDKQAR